MSDAFIWYHAPAGMEPALLRWLQDAGRETSMTARLYVRTEGARTTFMEVYSDISDEGLCRLGELAAASPLFDGVERHCECFRPAKPAS